MNILENLKTEYNIKIIDGYSEPENRNLTDIVIINDLYQTFMNQKSGKENNFTFVKNYEKCLSEKPPKTTCLRF